MPYIIHIPRPYQSRAHILPTKPTTTATHISINDWSPVARAVYADTTASGWNTEYFTKSTWKAEYGEWSAWRKMASKKGWFEDLFRFWQKEHGVRIVARQGICGTDRGSAVARFLRYVASTDGVTPRLAPRFVAWLQDERGLGGDVVLRGRQVVEPEGTMLLESQTTGQEEEVDTNTEEDSIASLPESLLGALAEWELDEEENKHHGLFDDNTFADPTPRAEADEAQKGNTGPRTKVQREPSWVYDVAWF